MCVYHSLNYCRKNRKANQNEKYRFMKNGIEYKWDLVTAFDIPGIRIANRL